MSTKTANPTSETPKVTTAAWPTDKVENWPLVRIRPHPKNPRTHPPEQIALLARMLAKYGPDQPIVVDENGEILKGHGRLLAAGIAGMAGFPVVQRVGLSESDKRAMRIADNQVALLSGWDEDLLRGDAVDLKADGYDLTLLGFPDIQLVQFMSGVGRTGNDPEAAPEPPVNPVSRSGDLWILGAHCLLCGDATKPADVATLMADVEPHLLVTDPPYGVDYDANWRNEAFRSDGSASDGRAVGTVTNDDRADWRDAWGLFPGDVVYTWSPPGSKQLETGAALEAAGFEIRQQIIWAKPGHVIGRGNYHYRHEPCWYAVRKSRTAHWNGARDQNTVWEITHTKSETGHSTQKPIECMQRPIENNSKRGDFVYDPFAGSGTTIIAAELTGRCCLAMEINPAYVDVSVERWQTFAGLEATLESTGETFAQVKAKRLAEPASAVVPARAPRKAKASPAPAPAEPPAA